MITTADVSSVDRNDLYQCQLNKYPAFLHFDGEKKCAGYFVFFALHSVLLIYPLIYTAIECIFKDWPVLESVAFIAIGLVFGYLPDIWFRFYCLYNKFNTALFIGFGGLLAYASVSYFIDAATNNTFVYEEILMVSFILFQLSIVGWTTLVVFIRGKSMEKACEIYEFETDREIELARINLFKTEDEKKHVKESNDPTFLDSEPTWNSKVVLRKSKVFCPKCGFGLVEGENECHVCGTIIEKTENGEGEET